LRRASSLRGEVLKVEDGVLHLKDNDGKICFVTIDKIVVVWEAREDEHRAGFVAKAPRNSFAGSVIKLKRRHPMRSPAFR